MPGMLPNRLPIKGSPAYKGPRERPSSLGILNIGLLINTPGKSSALPFASMQQDV